MIIYEVNLTVDQDIADEYRTWLEAHIEEMLTIDGFHAAKLYERDGDEAGGNGECWTIHYFLNDRRSLNDYFDNHAERLREEAMKRYAGKFTATRRVLEPMEKFVKEGEEFEIGG